MQRHAFSSSRCLPGDIAAHAKIWLCSQGGTYDEYVGIKMQPLRLHGKCEANLALRSLACVQGDATPVWYGQAK